MSSGSSARVPCGAIDTSLGPRQERLRAAVAAFQRYRTPGRLAAALQGGLPAPDEIVDGDARARVDDAAEELARRGADVLVVGDARYPQRLLTLPSPPPVLFAWGNLDLLDSPAVGMCGSRGVTEKGLDAARACGREVAKHGLTVVSGYAKGVDTETHLAALGSGGRTIVVLAEGILGFRVKRAFKETGFEEDRVLVLSQFAPSQRWNVGAAMTRNAVIAGLGRALVVIEAGATGGTLDAGMKALEMGRPVLALEFSEGTPPGNEMLFERGAARVATVGALRGALDAIGEPDRPAAQLRIV